MTISFNLLVLYLSLWCVLDQVSEAAFVTFNQTQGRRDKNDPGICGSFDIRNSVHLLENLRGCRVIEGFVQILLIEHANETDYDAYSFPELREITCFLLLYRVSGLKNLSQLFPNLSIIRGDELFDEYAFVVYEMFHLQEIGLTSLTAILRGGVRIEKNRSLCYVNTIDWSAMHSTANSKGEWDNFIADNEESSSCPRKCPSCIQSHCWTAQHCQRICPEICGFGVTCDVDINGSTFCCHHECIGGCAGPKESDCVACRHVTHEGVCINSCPKGSFRYQGRRCVSEEECFSIYFDNPLVSMDQDEEEHIRARRSVGVNRSWMIPFAGECVKECPPGTEEDAEGKGCRPCRDGACRKRCQGANVDSISSTQYYRGCTHVDGSLEIELEGRGGEQVTRELEENFGQIEEISGYLKVVRCVSLVSLDFLRNLRVVQGKTLDSDRFAIVVLDNQNLRRLWDWDERSGNLTVGNGRLFFHFNPHLCLSEIDKLRKMTNLSEHTYHEVNSDSNGDRGDCYDIEMHAHVILQSPTMVTLRWQHFDLNNQALLGYTFHYIEVLEDESVPEDSETCGRSWKVEYIMGKAGGNINVDVQEHNLTNLFPFTQYAYYFKTYDIISEGSLSGRSKIKYFRTPPSRPSMPLKLKAKSHSESSILLTWKFPLTPNGNISHYLVIGKLQKEDDLFPQQRDYCTQPIQLGNNTHQSNHYAVLKEATLLDIGQNSTSGINKKDYCSCKRKNVSCKVHDINYVREIGKNEKTEYSTCVNAIYSLLQSNTFYGEGTPADYTDMVIGAQESYEHSSEMHEGGAVVYFSKEVHDLAYNANGLRNYGLYIFEVKACQQPYSGEGRVNASLCSPSAVINIRTLPFIAADSIHSVRVFQENGSHFVFWEEPLTPNGVILTYNIEYQRYDISNIPPVKECVTNPQFRLNGGLLKLEGLPDGEYRIRIRANSLSGSGPFSESHTFSVSTMNPGSYDPGIIWGTVIALFIILIVFATFIYILNYKNGKLSFMELKLIASVNPDYLETIPEEIYKADAWEVQRSKIKLLKELGQGSFGMVYEGIMENPNGTHLPWLPCAVKTVHEGASVTERIDFLNEANVMKAFHTHHVVKLLGIVSQGSPTLVVMELMAVGDLKTYLRKQREIGDRLPFSRVTRMAAEVADGMAYLTSHKFVHRDLAARNCLVAADLTVKVGDFGMARDIYETDYYRKGTRGLLPVRWMAPESLRDGIFTCQSDVWSFGVLVWEMATLASQPYQGIANQQVLQFVIEGGVMTFPDQSPDLLNSIMRGCWKYRPLERPNFLQIITLLEPEIGEDFQNVSFFYSEEGKAEKLMQVSEVTSRNTVSVIRGVNVFDDLIVEETNVQEEGYIM